MSKLRYQPIHWMARLGPYGITVQTILLSTKTKAFAWTLRHNGRYLTEGTAPTLAKAKAAAEADLMLEMGWEE